MSPQPQDQKQPDPPRTELEAALYYASKGLPVFPCSPLTKHPLTPHGFYDAPPNEAQIPEWWTKWPNAMIGMPTGPRSGLWVTDTDIDPAENLDGEAELAKLIKQYGELPKTLMSTTPRGGRHRFFTWPSNID